MKRILLALAVLALAASFAGADSLDVNATAALNGTTNGLEVIHDNTSVAYVQDDTPNSETVYRFEFLYDPNQLGLTSSAQFRFSLFGAYANNPRPNNPGNPCPLNPNIPVFPARVFAVFGGANSEYPGVRMTLMTNQCGIVGTAAQYFTTGGVPDNNPRKICGYIENSTTPAGAGEGGLAVVAVGAACPPHGDPAYSTAPANNFEIPTQFVRLGNLAINPFNAGENGSFYVDEFASFRTMAP
ncbi:MAG: hypothetical protein DWQ36_10365 [Acidobacteria bacterium]|nr:MAG: hypothetical protein DWQ30_25600 [Acidobacteriota bacterium]REK07977.1 MAG: hypothetical protein DWQ36_10365 [Acidobacteriota bacterium]